MLRNRLKRRLREIVRQDFLAGERGVDVVVRTAPTAYAATFDELRTEMNGALSRLK